jgi:hypothetical protein
MKTLFKQLILFISFFFQVHLQAQVTIGTGGGIHVIENTVITILGSTNVQDATKFTIKKGGKARFGGILSSPGDLIFDGDIEFFNNVAQTNNFSMVTKDLTILSGSSLTINPAVNLTVNGTLENKAGNTGLVIASSASGTGSLLHNTDNVPGTIQRYVTGSSILDQLKYHFVSVPLIPSNESTSNMFLGSYLFDFNESANAWHPLGSALNTSLNETKGYMIYYPGDMKTYSFAGLMNNSNFTPAISYTMDKGYNLMPNPYPSSINWMSEAWTKTNIGSTFWIWNNGTYATFNSTAPDSLNGARRFIAPGQSFFVRANGMSPSLILTNSVRLHYPTTFLKSVQEIYNRLKVVASIPDYTDEAIVKFNDEGSSQEDDFDSRKLLGLGAVPQIYSLAGDLKLAINSLPVSMPEVTVPLCFQLDHDQSCTLNFSGIETFYNTANISLEDLVTGEWTDLNKHSQYNFLHVKGNRADRFLLHFSEITSIDDPAKEITFKVYLSNELITIQSPGLEGQVAEIIIINQLGQQYALYRQSICNLTQIPAPRVAGVYLVRITTGNKQFVTKIIVNS